MHSLNWQHSTLLVLLITSQLYLTESADSRFWQSGSGLQIMTGKCCPQSASVHLLRYFSSACRQGCYSLVKCDNYGYIVFQERRKSASYQVPFNRTWADYKRGFGNIVDGEFWMGNDALHYLTEFGSRLRVNMTLKSTMSRNDNRNRSFEIKYFSVAGEAARYKMTCETDTSNPSSLEKLATKHNNTDFATFDNMGGKDCAMKYGSGWWYSVCYTFNLNNNHAKSGTLSSSFRDLVKQKWEHNIEASSMKIKPYGC